MPYKTKSDPPENVANVLPDHAQKIYMEAYNSAWDHYDEPEERRGVSSHQETRLLGCLESGQIQIWKG